MENNACIKLFGFTAQPDEFSDKLSAMEAAYAAWAATKEVLVKSVDVKVGGADRACFAVVMTVTYRQA